MNRLMFGSISKNVKFIGCFFIFFNLVSCAGLGTSKYNFPLKFEQSHLNDAILFHNGHKIFWDDTHKASFFEKTKSKALTKLKEIYPVGMKIEVAQQKLLQSGFACNESAANKILSCQVKGISYVREFFWPFIDKCISQNERTITVFISGKTHIRNIDVTQYLVSTSCER